MNPPPSQAGSPFQAGPDSAITRLLFDVQCELGDALPDPDRLPFPELEPHYAYHAGQPLVGRLVAAWRDAAALGAGDRFKAPLLGALERCATQFLGRDRTLVVVDTAWSLAPEAFSHALWEALLWRAPEPQWPVWWRLMVLRLEEYRIVLPLQPARWQQLVAGIEPAGLGALLRWAVTTAKGPRRDTHIRRLLAEARRRCVREPAQFQAADVDAYAVLEAAEDLAVGHGIALGPAKLAVTAGARQEMQRQCLRDALPKAMRTSDDARLPRRQDTESLW